MHNKYFPIAIFMCLFLSSLLAGHYSFREAQRAISDDLSQALLQTFKENKSAFVCRDTIRAYKQLQESAGGQVALFITDDKFKKYLKHDELKQGAYVSFGLYSREVDPNRSKWEPNYRTFSDFRIQSDTLIIDDNQLGETVVLKGISEPALATIFRISDQRLSLTLASASLLWALFVFYRKRREQTDEFGDQPLLVVDSNHTDEQLSALTDRPTVVQNSYGGMCFSEKNDVFYGLNGEPVHFTPMQQQLMCMFWQEPSRTLSKEVICAKLWPKKEDANDTLYTLVRRLKPVLEEHSELMLVVDRGKSYSLVIR